MVSNPTAVSSADGLAPLKREPRHAKRLVTPQTASIGDPRPIGPAYAIVTVCCCLFLLVIGLAAENHDYSLQHGLHYQEQFHHYNDADQYACLADALLAGRLDLDLPVSEELLALDDPYDYDARYAIGSPDVPIFWDHAFYDGKYYSYFGVVPALALYAPYRFLTGEALGTVVAVIVFAVLYVLASSALVLRLRRRWFSHVGTLPTCLAFLAFFFGGNAIYLTSVPRFYSVPLLCGLASLCLGLWFWFGARRDGRFSAPLLFLGSLFVALVLGCRPQLCLVWFVAFPLFWHDVFVDRALFSRRSVGQSIAVLAPFAIVGAGIGWYNWARFGSPLDFGAYYNLTIFDMVDYQQSWLLTLILTGIMFFVPVRFSGTFPFLVRSGAMGFAKDVFGYAPAEPMFGGYFWSVPTTWMLTLFPGQWRRLRKKGLAFLVLVLGISAIVVCVFDVRSAGTSQRYVSDFGWALSLATIITYFSRLECAGSSRWPITRIFLALVVVSGVLAIWALFSPDHWSGLWGYLEPFFGG